jgi:hypothetical protein
MYSFTVPANNPAGGFVRVTFTEVGINGDMDVKLYSATDNSEAKEIYTINSGSSLEGYLAVAAGKTYRIAVSDFAGNSPVRYTMNTVYTGLVDLYEPNDTRETAKPIAVGTPISAYLSTGYVEDPYTGDAFVDYYSVALAAGSVVIKMSTVPTDIMGEVQLLDPDMVAVGEGSSTTPGANVTLTAEVATAGTYTVQVIPYLGWPDPAGEIVGGLPPDHFTRPYTLTVTQP